MLVDRLTLQKIDDIGRNIMNDMSIKEQMMQLTINVFYLTMIKLCLNVCKFTNHLLAMMIFILLVD